MQKWRHLLRAPGIACCLWVALCFGVTSAVYLSWLNRLVVLLRSAAVDWFTMVAGYLMQAAGLGLIWLWLRRDPDRDHRRAFIIVCALFAAMTMPALLTDSPAGAVGFGLIVNLLCGTVAGFYLYAIARHVSADLRGRVFGGGYALATLAVGLLALIGRENLLHSRYATLIYLPLCAAAICAILRMDALNASEGDTPAAAKPTPVALACVVVALLSAVKNLGFCFPSADIHAGVIPELSRLPYAAGLIAAGFITDRNRQHGMICTVAALIIPFIMLGLTSEPISATIFWGLDYLFYAFFSVFRVVLFLDIAQRSRRWALATMGLLMGRLGDAAGTAVGLLLASHRVALIVVTALAFFPTVFLFLRLFQALYEPEKALQRTEQETFELFCLQNDLSPREREVLRMVIDNRSNNEISETLFITESTVKYHVRNVLQKAGCKNRVELQKKYTLAMYPHLESVSQKP